ncbi:class I adenylate-forming enzyme family protein [Hydrogenophaga sp.]|uniref:class I adenylate-forming enzyme family protein n=1 Tax=Hydrogenophaga sp. TaxID=1904254 RepID=UPI00271C125D|nr:class I adenylate-forming enzyme family protein [Hydrogenophaga sp.]MDO9435375.1 class I adenylate-forming enzyme family protein [Hydrogenophaga sp.]
MNPVHVIPRDHSTLAAAYLASARCFGDRDAIKPIGQPAIRYDELFTRVKTAVSVLSEFGLKPGEKIAICLPNCPEWAVFTYAAALMGLCIIPVNVRYRADEMELILAGSDASCLVTQKSFMTNAFVDRLSEIAKGQVGSGETAAIASLPALRRILLVDGGSVPGMVDYRKAAAKVRHEVDVERLAGERHADEPLYLFWTSGTTSAPKGALLPQSSIDQIWAWTTLAGYRNDDRVLTARPFFYIAGNFWTLVAPMLYGALSVISDELSSEQMQQLCLENQVTVLNGNPLMMKKIIEDPGYDRRAFAHIRMGMFGGSSMPADELMRIKQEIGYTDFLQTYGMTEFAGFVLSTRPGDSIEATVNTCGLPFTDVQMKLVNSETGAEVAKGEPGMVVVKGIKLIRYLNLTEVDHRKLFDDEGWYRTGDLMLERPDGRYEFVGRSKDLIKVNGENATAADIESSLMKHPSINLAAVIGRPDAARGEVPVAFLEAKGGRPTDHALKAWCKNKMAPYKVPVEFHWVLPEAWPMTISGKIAKHRLMAEAAQGSTP